LTLVNKMRRIDCFYCPVCDKWFKPEAKLSEFVEHIMQHKKFDLANVIVRIELGE